MPGLAALLFTVVMSYAAAGGSEDGLILFIQELDLEARPREEAWGLPSKVLRDDVGGQFLMFFDCPGINEVVDAAGPDATDDWVVSSGALT